MSFNTHTLHTKDEDMLDITKQVQEDLAKSGVERGLCVVYCPHTTAGITINENADADVQRDVQFGLSQAFPKRCEFKHFEGNSHAHLQSSVVGASEMLIVEAGALLLGRWQGIYFCEFDGPRLREFHVKIISG